MYKRLIIEMINKIENEKVLVAIYTYIKTLIEE